MKENKKETRGRKVGYKHSQKTINDISESLLNPNKKRKHSAIHKHLYAKYGKASVCENRQNKILHFGCSKKSQTFTWAKKKKSEYTTNKDDYYQLCSSCHTKYDTTEETIKKRSNALKGIPSPFKNKKRPEVSKGLRGKKKSKIHKENIRKAIIEYYKTKHP